MEDNLCFLFGDTARMHRRALNQRARDLGVTGAQWRLLAWLKRYPGAKQAALAELLDVEPISCSRMVDRLVDAGLVERHADPADRRAWRLQLTSAAEPLVQRFRAVANEVLDEALTGLNDAERQALSTLMVKIRANLSRKEGEVHGLTC